MRILHMLFTVLGYHRVTSVIIIDCFSTRAFWFAYLTARLSVTLGVPYIAIVRGGDFESRLNKSPEACRFLFNRSERNIVPSRYLKSIFDRYNILTDIIPNFIEIEKYL
ncbi:MAG: hypothetical protein NZ522_07595, partial [Chitinophagales bacterium]|nr:hypothetical protein [Chitinophagales bacterium]